MASTIGETLETLAATIASRRGATEESYTYRLLTGSEDEPLKKLVEESTELALAAKDLVTLEKQVELEPVDQDPTTLLANDRVRAHARYEAGDVVYHLLVVLERLGITLDDLAAELNTRMTPEVQAARPGAPTLTPEEVNRGKA